MPTIHDIPVLFFPFSRPQYARKVFDVIKRVKPNKLYFYCDKARKENLKELKNNNIIKNYIKEVDWECELKTWFRDENIGVYTSIMNAIDWFFENEEMGIILEEDCLPSIAFFDFCRQLLPKYKNDERVWLISGNNFLEGYNPSNYDYIFSSATSYMWGWATWRSRWMKINRDGFFVPEIINYKLNYQFFGNKKSGEIEDYKLKQLQDKNGYLRPVSWDVIFQISMRVSGGIGIIPICNLASNIGTVGTHSKKSGKFHNVSIPDCGTYKIIKHPPFVVSDFRYTQKFVQWNYRYFFFKKLKRKIKDLLR